MEFWSLPHYGEDSASDPLDAFWDPLNPSPLDGAQSSSMSRPESAEPLLAQEMSLRLKQQPDDCNADFPLSQHGEAQPELSFSTEKPEEPTAELWQQELHRRPSQRGSVGRWLETKHKDDAIPGFALWPVLPTQSIRRLRSGTSIPLKRRSILDLPTELVSLCVSMLESADISRFSRTAHASQVIGERYVGARVYIWRDSYQLVSFCNFMLAPGRDGAHRVLTLRALSVAPTWANGEPALQNIDKSAQAYTALVLVLTGASNLWEVRLPCAYLFVGKFISLDEFPEDLLFRRQLRSIHLRDLDWASEQVLAHQIQLRKAAIADRVGRDYCPLRALEGAQETLRELCIFQNDRAVPRNSLGPLLPYERTWPHVQTLQVEEIELCQAPLAMPGVRRLLIHDRVMFGPNQRNPPAAPWASFDCLYATIPGVVNNLNSVFPPRCRTLELNFSEPLLAGDRSVRLDIAQFLSQADPDNLALRWGASGAPWAAQLLTSVMAMTQSLKYLSLHFVRMERRLRQPTAHHVGSEIIVEALKSGCEVTPPSPVVWSYPRLGASGPVLDLSEHLTLLTHILAMVPKSISYIDLSPFILSSGSKTPRSVWRVVAQPEEAAHNFEVEMLSQEAADSARKQAGFVDAIYWEKDFCEVEV